MAQKSESQLSLVIKAVDQATAPLKEINAKIKAFTQPVKALNNSFRALSKESGLMGLGHSVKHVGHAIGEVGAQAAELGKKFLEIGAVAGFALYEMVKGAVEAGSELYFAAKRVGLTVDAYGQLSFAAKQAHISQEEFTGAMDKFSKSLGQAKAGGGPLLEFLNKVSPTLAAQIKHVHGTQEGLDLMAKAFVKVTDPNKRAALQQAAFGRSSKEMGEFLGQGTEKIHEQMAESLRLTGSQKEFADQSKETEEALNETSAAFDGIRNAAATGLMPALRELAKAVTDLLVANRGGIKKWADEAGKAITDWVKGGGIERLIDGFKKFSKGVGEVVDMLGGFRNVAIGAGLIMAGPLLAAVVGLGSAVWGVVPAISAMALRIGLLVFGPWITGMVAVIPMIGSMSEAMTAFNLVLNANPVGAVVLAVSSLVAVGYQVYKNWEPIKQLFADIWYNIKQFKNIGISSAGFNFRHLSGEYDAAPAFKGLPASSMRNAGAALGADAAAPGAASGGAAPEAKVTVDFVNMPRGTRVKEAPGGTADMDLLMGYAGVIP